MSEFKPIEGISFEDAMRELNEITAKLERNDCPLDESVRLFERGKKLSAFCAKQLDDAEQCVLRLTKGEDGAPVETKISE